jgi:hypothetical protein
MASLWYGTGAATKKEQSNTKDFQGGADDYQKTYC